MTIALKSPALVPLTDVALFFDVDGTLVDIEQEPALVKVSKQLQDLLSRLIDTTNGALALVSGRPIDQLDDLFKPLLFSASGLHGLERRLLPGAVARATENQENLMSAKRDLERFASLHKGVFVEDKGLTLALHYRMAPERHETAARYVRDIVDSSQGTLVLLEGKMVFELKPPGFDKGRAIAEFMQEPPFRGRCPIFAGDDVTDEAGFTVVNAMSGLSVKIGIDGRETEANHGLETVQATLAWLNDLVTQQDENAGDGS